MFVRRIAVRRGKQWSVVSDQWPDLDRKKILRSILVKRLESLANPAKNRRINPAVTERERSLRQCGPHGVSVMRPFQDVFIRFIVASISKFRLYDPSGLNVKIGDYGGMWLRQSRFLMV
jgi:hypothetical protein